jgi:O-acetyl-ADP-ribose deacetylase (regulator of RNase III)
LAVAVAKRARGQRVGGGVAARIDDAIGSAYADEVMGARIRSAFLLRAILAA